MFTKRIRLEDLSNNNSVDEAYFRAAKRRGLAGVYHKRTQGDYFVDERADQRRAWALKWGLLWGEYHFHDPRVDAAKQAAFFLEHAPPDGWQLLPALDAEMSASLPAATIGANALAVELHWRHDRRLAGAWPLTYSYPSFLRNLRPLVGRSPLWISDPDRRGSLLGPRCYPWATWTLWQDATRGRDTDCLRANLNTILLPRAAARPRRQRVPARPALTAPRLWTQLAAGARL